MGGYHSKTLSPFTFDVNWSLYGVYPEAVVVGSDSRKPSKESLEKRSSGDSGSDRNKSTVEQYVNESINHQMSESSEKISRKVPTNKAAKKVSCKLPCVP